ncbi:MAG TPA: hypothetical protein VFK56_14955 [Mycobacterium sp.]|nr:hypothetical protein [Mycobacterium sp.]
MAETSEISQASHKYLWRRTIRLFMFEAAGYEEQKIGIVVLQGVSRLP